jgi:uncharacterized glyoxalase superfamily protein PhnB
LLVSTTFSVAPTGRTTLRDDEERLMKPTPKDWQRFNSGLFYDDAPAAIDWLCRVFGFKVRLKVEGEDGDIVHSELEYADGLVMVGSARRREGRVSPRAIGGKNTQSVMVFVDDADAHCAHSRAQGAKILAEPESHDYGEEYWTDRTYEVEDLEGHRFWFTQRMRG